MKAVGEAPMRFRVSEFAPQMTDWGHTGYVSVEPQGDFSIADKTQLAIFFTPRNGTTFEQVEHLVRQLNDVLEKVHFNTVVR